MSVKKGRSTLVGALAVFAMALFAQGAQAAITPSVTLDQSSGTQAGGFHDLGMDLTFDGAKPLTPPISDTPQNLTINLPPGLLANATVNGGKCLTETTLDDNCQVGSGSVTAYAASLVPLTVDVTFDLVAPPAPGDLAGLAVNMSGTQIGSTGDIKVRPSGDPNGVGVTILLSLPNSLDGAPIDISEINSTFSGLRYPTTCPSTPANVGISVNSYSDATVHTITAPLSVTGCSSLPYAPKLSVSAVKDSGDRVVAITTGVTQAADESPTKNLALSFPDATLGVNLAVGQTALRPDLEQLHPCGNRYGRLAAVSETAHGQGLPDGYGARAGPDARVPGAVPADTDGQRDAHDQECRVHRACLTSP